MTYSDYVELAHRDPVWCEVVASMKISGFRLDSDIEVLVGKLIVGEISIDELVQTLS
jgi:hypothetical protein